MGISFPLTGGYLAKTEHSVDWAKNLHWKSLEIMISTPKSRGLKSYWEWPDTSR
jgi:cephalosporin-C deacetylase-like acetyl esterase